MHLNPLTWQSCLSISTFAIDGTGGCTPWCDGLPCWEHGGPELIKPVHRCLLQGDTPGALLKAILKMPQDLGSTSRTFNASLDRVFSSPKVEVCAQQCCLMWWEPRDVMSMWFCGKICIVLKPSGFSDLSCKMGQENLVLCTCHTDRIWSGGENPLNAPSVHQTQSCSREVLWMQF